MPVKITLSSLIGKRSDASKMSKHQSYTKEDVIHLPSHDITIPMSSGMIEI